MRYIRTKEGIYERQEKTDSLEKYMPFDTNYIKDSGGIRIAYDVIKESDSIEELCDWFACETRDIVTGKLLSCYTDFKLWHCEIEAKAQDEYNVYAKSVVYGVICTDKGLIYVAKMNEKGELELL